jgi:hypothetical protein
MTNEENKLSNGKKIYYISGIAIILAATGYNFYRVFSKESFDMGDIGTLTSQAVMFIFAYSGMKPIFKRW